MSDTYRVALEKITADANTFVGRVGDIFFDPTAPTLKVGDGTTPGGSLLSGGVGTKGTATIASNAITIDLSKSLVTVSLTANVTTINFTNPPAAGKASATLVVFTQDATGGRTVSGTGYLTQSALGLTITPTQNATSLISFVAYGSTIIALNVGQDYR